LVGIKNGRKDSPQIKIKEDLIMRINHNISALNTYRQLTINNTAGNKSLEKLSSGYRINRAGDDAAGLAISEKMRGQIRGLNQAERNSQDAISLIQTAEGALNETHSILQRMRELAVQSASDTNTDADRAEIQKEIEQLTSELDRISTDTEFNTKKLLDGTISNSAKLDAANAAKLSGVAISDDTLVGGDYTVTVSSVTATATMDEAGSTTMNDTITIDDDGADLAAGSYTLELIANGTNFDAVLKNAAGEEVASVFNEALTNKTSAATLEIGGLTFNWGASSTGSNTIAAGTAKFTIDIDATFSVKDSANKEIGATTVSNNTNGKVNVGGLALEFNASLTESTSTVTVATDAVKFQIGANEGQQTALSISDMSAAALKVDAIDLSTREGASSAITTIENAISTVSSERAKLGAMQNRLEHTINNLGTTSENLTASEARIRDVDMAKEMMEFTKNSILQQAATAMLAQANQQPQGVLQLLQ
jgi:flagellin